MQLCDVNVLVYAHREESERHEQFREIVETMAAGPKRYGVSELILSGFVRVVTRPRLFDPPTPLPVALEFAGALRDAGAAVIMRPGPDHWSLFAQLLLASDTTGSRVSDAYHAALAVEHGAQILTTDRDFARFPGLRWRHPLEG